MVSLDPAERNREFGESLGVKTPLLSDPTGKAARDFGVATGGMKSARRWTFVIDRDGIVRHIDREVKASSHGSDLMDTLKGLFPSRAAPQP